VLRQRRVAPHRRLIANDAIGDDGGGLAALLLRPCRRRLLVVGW
jgi:hypothetical protein